MWKVGGKKMNCCLLNTQHVDLGQASQSNQMSTEVTFPLVENKTLDQSFGLWVEISRINCLADTRWVQKLKFTSQCHFGELVQPTVGYGAGEEIAIHVQIQMWKENSNIQNTFPPNFKSVQAQGLVLTL